MVVKKSTPVAVIETRCDRSQEIKKGVFVSEYIENQRFFLSKVLAWLAA